MLIQKFSERLDGFIYERGSYTRDFEVPKLDFNGNKYNPCFGIFESFRKTFTKLVNGWATLYSRGLIFEEDYAHDST